MGEIGSPSGYEREERPKEKRKGVEQRWWKQKDLIIISKSEVEINPVLMSWSNIFEREIDVGGQSRP